MRKHLASLALIAFFSGGAHAADLGPGPMPQAMPGPMPYSWAGFYIGGNAGGAWGDISNSLHVTNGNPGYFNPAAISGVNASGSSGLESMDSLAADKSATTFNLRTGFGASKQIFNLSI